MPVTAKLSKAFYKKLGHEVTDELVDYLNDVDAAYRSDLRDLNEQNFLRFEAKLDQRFAEFETRFAQFETRFAQFEAKWEAKFAHLETTLERRINAQTRWMFGAWAMLLIPILGLWFRG